jgi:hypothetical protein
VRPVELGRLQPGETAEEHKAAVAAVLAEQAQTRAALVAAFASAQRIADRMAADLAEQFRLIGQALANAVSADPDEPSWFDAMRYDPDASEEWTP